MPSQFMKTEFYIQVQVFFTNKLSINILKIWFLQKLRIIGVLTKIL